MKFLEKAQLETESRPVVGRAVAGAGAGVGTDHNGYEENFGGDASVLKLDCGDGCTTI